MRDRDARAPVAAGRWGADRFAVRMLATAGRIANPSRAGTLTGAINAARSGAINAAMSSTIATQPVPSGPSAKSFAEKYLQPGGCV